MTSEICPQRFVRRIRCVLALATVLGCAGESPPVEELPEEPAGAVVEAIGDTVADTVMARDTAR